jgi:hypothetical protein
MLPRNGAAYRQRVTSSHRERACRHAATPLFGGALRALAFAECAWNVGQAGVLPC